MKKRLLVFTVALTMMASFFYTSMAFAETTENAMVGTGCVGDELSYTLYENGDIVVNADETEAAYVMAASYKDGRMVSIDRIDLDEEGSKLNLEDWGQSIKLFAVSEGYMPIGKAVEIWNADDVVENSDDLQTMIEAAQEGETLVINVDKTAVLEKDVAATFAGKKLIINFNDVDMADKNLKITAPNATSIVLNDNADGKEGTEVGTLTIDAPNADVENNIFAENIEIIAVSDGTFHAKDKVGNEIKIKKGAVDVDHKAGDTTVTVPEGADGVKIRGTVNEVNIETTEEVVLDAEITTANVTVEGAKVVVEENAVVATVVVSAETTEEAKTEITGAGIIDIIEAITDVIISATNVTEVEVSGGITVEIRANVEYVNVPAATEAPTIKVEVGVTVENVTTETDVNVTGSGSIENVTVNGSEDVTITAPEDSEIKVEAIVNTGSGNVEIKNESNNNAELPEDSSAATMVTDAVEEVNIDFATSDEWRTEGYLYQFFDINFKGAEWAVTEEEFDWNKVTYWVNDEQFIWDVETSKPGDFAVEADLMGYSYDEDTETGYAQGLIAVYETNVKVGESYDVEIRFPSNYLCVTNKDYVISGKTVTVDLEVNITDSETELTPAKDELDTITINAGTADDWRTEGYVYVEKEITFEGAEWSMEPYWEEHVTYWIDGEQFQWIPGESVVGDYAVEVEMVPEYDEDGNLSMKAMVFAYMENVKDGDSFDMEIRVPTYSLARTDEEHRITRDESAVIDFKVQIEGCENYVPSVVDRVEDVSIDLSASDEWRTDGYLYEFFDIDFNAAEWAAEGLDWDAVEYYVNDEKFEWIVEGENASEPGDFEVEVDLFDYYYDEETEKGYATGLIAAYVDNVTADTSYEVEIRFPSDHLRITDENYEIKSGETFIVDFNVNITDSKENLKPAKDTLDEMLLYTKGADKNGYMFAEKEVTFNGAAWRMEPYWDAHVTYEVSNEDVYVDLIPRYDDETGELFMDAIAEANTDDVAAGENVTVKIYIPTYSLERTEDVYRITRNESAVIDFTVKITDAEIFCANVHSTRVDCHMDDEVVTEGEITVGFEYENYAEPVAFGLMEHCEDDEDIVAAVATFDSETESGTEGSVTFDMTDVSRADYEVVYLVAGTWYGTGEYINLWENDDSDISEPSLWFEVEEPGQILAGGTAVFDSMLLLRDTAFVEGEEITFTLNDGFTFAEDMSIYDVNNLITIQSVNDNELVILAPSDINGEFGLDGLTIVADADVTVGTKAVLTASMDGYTSAKEKIATVVDQIVDNVWLDFDEIEIAAGEEASFESICIMKYFEFEPGEKVTLTLSDGFTFAADQKMIDGATVISYVLNSDKEMVVTAPEDPGNGFDLTGLTIAADVSLAEGDEAELTVVVEGCAAFKDTVATVGDSVSVTDELTLDVEPIEIAAGGEGSFSRLGVDKEIEFTEGEKVILTLSEGFSFIENDDFHDGDGTLIEVSSWSANEIVVLAPKDPGNGFDLEELTIVADADLEEGTTAIMTASVDGCAPVSETVATVVTVSGNAVEYNAEFSETGAEGNDHSCI